GPAALAIACVLCAAPRAHAQIRPLNSAGVAAAHEHLVVTDQAASTAFWSALGGTADHVGTIAGVRFPGVYILFQMNRAAAPPEGSVGGVADTIGLKVKDLAATLARVEPLGIHPEPGASATTASLMSPEK